MTIHFYTPQRPLSTFVDLMWLYDGYTSPYAQERALPTGTATLVINLAQRMASFGGVHSQSIQIETAQLASHIGVHFRAGGAFPFLPLPVGELHNQIVALDELWGSAVYTLRDRLLAAAAPQAKFQVLEQTLLAQVRQSAARHPVLTPALQDLQQPAALRVEEVANQIGVTTRRLHQLFHKEVGISPKLYQRLQRFQQVLRQLYRRPTAVDWADLAVDHGYFDQSHLINEFQHFAALTPGHYLAQRGREPNHVPLTPS